MYEDSICFQGLRPHNRLRYTSSLMCSGCSSVISANVSRVNSRMTSRAQSQVGNFRKTGKSSTLFFYRSTFFTLTLKMSLATCGGRRKSGMIGTLSEEKDFACKICLFEYPQREMAKLQMCGCFFCEEVVLCSFNFSITLLSSLS